MNFAGFDQPEGLPLTNARDQCHGFGSRHDRERFAIRADLVYRGRALPQKNRLFFFENDFGSLLHDKFSCLAFSLGLELLDSIDHQVFPPIFRSASLSVLSAKES